MSACLMHHSPVFSPDNKDIQGCSLQRKEQIIRLMISILKSLPIFDRKPMLLATPRGGCPRSPVSLHVSLLYFQFIQGTEEAGILRLEADFDSVLQPSKKSSILGFKKNSMPRKFWITVYIHGTEGVSTEYAHGTPMVQHETCSNV